MWRKGTLLHCWWECKLVQLLWRTVWRFLKNLKIDLYMTQQSHLWAHTQVCAHAKFLQSCPTLCDPMECNPPGSSVHEILQARILE